MMKKALAYAMTAVFLGVATMLAPLVLIESGSIRFLGSGDGEKALVPCSRAETLDAENTFSEEDSLRRAISPPNLYSAGLMLIPSFLVALGAFLYLKKRMF